MTVTDNRRARWTLIVALVGGNVWGLWDDWPALAAALRGHPNPYVLDDPVRDLLGYLILPALVTGLAPRRPFLWGAVPLGLELAWSLVDRAVAQNWPGLVSDLQENSVVSILSLLLVCGPISLVRLVRRRKREGAARRVAEEQEWQRAASEGVWPPPPSGLG